MAENKGKKVMEKQKRKGKHMKASPKPKKKNTYAGREKIHPDTWKQRIKITE